jgi:hypothetical protein
VLRSLHRGFDRPFDEKRFAFVLAERPRSEHGAHAYAFADLGLDAEAERSHHRRYQRHFGVPTESAPDASTGDVRHE